MSYDATFSPCRKYRYLWSTVVTPLCEHRRRVAFVMLNPSTADELNPDPTIRRCIGFAKAWGFYALDVCNLFAWRSYIPKDLKIPEDPIGPDNDATLERIVGGADRIVLAWGSHHEVRKLIAARASDVAILVDNETKGRQVGHMGLCKDGNPRHPLMLKKASVFTGARALTWRAWGHWKAHLLDSWGGGWGNEETKK